jgi:hypothetical protein
MMIAAQEGKILPSHLSSDPTLRQRFEQPDGRQPLSYRITEGLPVILVKTPVPKTGLAEN